MLPWAGKPTALDICVRMRWVREGGRASNKTVVPAGRARLHGAQQPGSSAHKPGRSPAMQPDAAPASASRGRSFRAHSTMNRPSALFLGLFIVVLALGLFIVVLQHPPAGWLSCTLSAGPA